MRIRIILPIYLLFFLYASLGLVESTSDGLSCNVTTDCSYTTVFKMSSTTNAHVEVPTLTNYSNKVCCQRPGGTLGTSCTTGYTVLRLSDNTNAHVEKNIYADYPVSVCLSSPYTFIECAYAMQDCNETGYDTCLARISGDTNAHVSDCASTIYPTRICCKIAGNFSDTSCEPDCTLFSDEIVHASCDGQNGCSFYDSISKAACDNSQPGWVRDYNSTHYVICPSGSPQLKIEIEANVSCTSGTLVKVTRIVVYNGKPVKLIVAACG